MATIRDRPFWFRGSVRRAYSIDVPEWRRSKCTASWKLFALIPRVLLRRTARGGRGGRDELEGRMARFLAEEMGSLVAEARTAPAPSKIPPDRRTEEAALLEAVCAKVCLGEVSRARQLATSSGIAPGLPKLWRSSGLPTFVRCG